MKKLNMNSRANQSGFTLIELIVVMVILGIMAATALPKFADLGTDARIAKLNAAIGAIKATNSNVHASWLAGGNTGAAAVSLEGVDYTTTAAGYLAAANVEAAAGLDGYTVTAADGVATVKTDSGRSNCEFTYTEATRVISTPTTTGC